MTATIPVEQISKTKKDALSTVVAQKRGNNKEFFINFFERCNLACAFCWQDHSDWTGINTIVSKADAVVAATNDSFYYDVNVMGGELFMDELPDRIFEDYLEFCRRVDSQVAQCSVNFVTNMVFEKTQRVVRFFERLEEEGLRFTVTTSYDPSGRFNPKTLELFEQNLPYFSDWLSNISVVLTKPNMHYFMNKTDPVFDRLYARYTMFFDYYSPEENYKKLQPTDELIADFFIWLNENYPEAQPIRDFRENSNNPATCRSSLVILPSGTMGSCRVLADTTKFKSDPDVKDNIHEMEARFIDHYDCLSCEFYSRCGLGCFLHHDHISLTTKDCQFKRMFREILDE